MRELKMRERQKYKAVKANLAFSTPAFSAFPIGTGDMQLEAQLG